MTTVTAKVGGSTLEDEGAVASLVAQVDQLRDEGVRVCLVHGGGPQISRALAAAGIEDERHDGLRVTSPEAAELVRRELDAVGKELAAELARAGLPVFHVDSAQERLSARVKPAEVDLGRVGEPVGFDGVGLPGPVGGRVPVVTPVGADEEGPLNVNADEAAACVAATIGSDRLVLATDVDGVQADGTTLDQLDATRARELIEAGVTTEGMIPKLEAGLAALSNGVKRVALGRIRPDGLVAATRPGPSPGTRLVDRKGVPA